MINGSRQHSTVDLVGHASGFDDAVALAADCFQPRAIEKTDMSGRIANQFVSLKQGRRLADFLPPHTHHAGHKLMCHRKLVCSRLIVRKEQPTRKAFIYLMEVVTNSRLMSLR